MKEHNHKLLYNRDIHIVSVGLLTGSHRYYHLFLAIQDPKCLTFIFHEHISLSCDWQMALRLKGLWQLWELNILTPQWQSFHDNANSDSMKPACGCLLAVWPSIVCCRRWWYAANVFLPLVVPAIQFHVGPVKWEAELCDVRCNIWSTQQSIDFFKCQFVLCGGILLRSFSMSCHITCWRTASRMAGKCEWL